MLGFDVGDALAIIDALGKLPEVRLRTRAEEVKAADRQATRGLSRRKARKTRKGLRNALAAWFWIAIGDAHQFTDEQLSSRVR